MNAVTIRILLCGLGIFFVLTQATSAKSTYPPGNYYEESKHSPNCMRCHMLGGLNPAGTTLSLAISKATVVPDEQITVTVTKNSFDMAQKPGVAIHMANNDKYAQRIPQDYGWKVVSNTDGLPFNYCRTMADGVNSLIWSLKAPKKPGQYIIATSAYFANADLPGTKRGNNTVTVTVNKVPEGQKPFVVKVEGRYKTYLFVTFSEPVEETAALTKSNYSIQRVATGQALVIDSIFMSRDGAQAVLRTGPHSSGSQYSLRIANVADYAASPNRIADTSVVYAPDLVTSFIVPCNYTQDLTATKLLYDDRTDYLGTGTQANAARINLAFYTAPTTAQNLDKAIDALTGIDFVKAKLVLRQAESPSTGGIGTWNAYAVSGSMMAETPVGELWSGLSPGATPVATLSKSVGTVSNGSPDVRWEWDITQNFRALYRAGAGEIHYRLQSGNENNVLMAGFFGADHDSLGYRPYIELIPDTSLASSIHGRQEIRPGYPSMNPRTIPLGGGALIYCAPLPGLQGSKDVSIAIYAVSGRKVTGLFSGPGNSLPREIFWNGKDEFGSPSPSGLYLTRFQFGNRTFSTNTVLLR